MVHEARGNIQICIVCQSIMMLSGKCDDGFNHFSRDVRKVFRKILLTFTTT